MGWSFLFLPQGGAGLNPSWLPALYPQIPFEKSLLVPGDRVQAPDLGPGLPGAEAGSGSPVCEACGSLVLGSRAAARLAWSGSVLWPHPGREGCLPSSPGSVRCSARWSESSQGAGGLWKDGSRLQVTEPGEGGHPRCFLGALAGSAGCPRSSLDRTAPAVPVRRGSISVCPGATGARLRFPQTPGK